MRKRKGKQIRKVILVCRNRSLFGSTSLRFLVAEKHNTLQKRAPSPRSYRTDKTALGNQKKKVVENNVAYKVLVVKGRKIVNRPLQRLFVYASASRCSSRLERGLFKSTKVKALFVVVV